MMWQPTTTIAGLQRRAQILKEIRLFFEIRNILEVDTPILSEASVTDPFIASFETNLKFQGQVPGKSLYLQTSPEYYMKRLLAAGAGSIYQICKAFRNGEVGYKHNPEFTILEWYRVGFNHHDLMTEVDELLHCILQTPPADRISYNSLFKLHFDINPHTCTIEVLETLANQYQISYQKDQHTDKDTWLDLLMTHIIEPTLGKEKPIFIFDYPVSQAALAKSRTEDDYIVGERFELYYRGVELANGFHELNEPTEQAQRFDQDNRLRKNLNLPTMPIDAPFLASLEFLPDTAGVALGLDRLILLATQSNNIATVISFPLRIE